MNDVARASVSTANWLEETLRTLSKIGELKANWDSYGAAAVSKESIAVAQKVISDLAAVDGVEKPVVTASRTGNAAFCWDNGERSLDIEVQPTGQVDYVFLRERESVEEEGSTTDHSKLAGFLTR